MKLKSVHGKRRTPIVAGVLAFGLTLCVACASFLYLSFLSYPSTRSIGNKYLTAVINGDLSAVHGLARSKVECQQAIEEEALQDIQAFGSAQVRDVSIDVRPNDGSDGQIQIAVVEFEYFRPGHHDWQRGSLWLVTDHDVPGFRYLCGSGR